VIIGILVTGNGNPDEFQDEWFNFSSSFFGQKLHKYTLLWSKANLILLVDLHLNCKNKNKNTSIQSTISHQNT
jgi:hypothetical protein